MIITSLLCINIAGASELSVDYFDIAVNYFNENNYPKALEYLDSVLKIEPDNLNAYTLKNRIFKGNLHSNENKNIIIEDVTTNEKAQEKK